MNFNNEFVYIISNYSKKGYYLNLLRSIAHIYQSYTRGVRGGKEKLLSK